MRTLDLIPEPKARQGIVWLLIANAVVWGVGIVIKLITPYL